MYFMKPTSSALRSIYVKAYLINIHIVSGSQYPVRVHFNPSTETALREKSVLCSQVA